METLVCTTASLEVVVLNLIAHEELFGVLGNPYKTAKSGQETSRELGMGITGTWRGQP